MTTPDQPDLFGNPTRRKRLKKAPGKKQRNAEAEHVAALRQGWQGALDELQPAIQSGDLAQIKHKFDRLRV